jgi:hypothetical protein
MTGVNLAEWIEPASIEITDASLAKFEQIVSILSDHADRELVVLAAHGEFERGKRDVLDEIAASVDSTYVAGRRDELIAHLAAAAVAERLLEEPSERSTSDALLVQSARFIDLKPTVSELRSLAESAATKAAANERERPALKGITPAMRKAVAGDGTTIEENAQGIAAIARGVETLIANSHKRFELMDEEINTLWWARRTTSSTSGVLWSEMSELERPVFAARDVINFAKYLPASPAIVSLAEQVGGLSTSKVQLTDLLAKVLEAFPRAAGTSRFTPLFTGAKILGQYSDEPEVAAGVMKGIGVNPKLKVRFDQIAAQLLREHAILASAS